MLMSRGDTRMKKVLAIVLIGLMTGCAYDGPTRTSFVGPEVPPEKKENIGQKEAEANPYLNDNDLFQMETMQDTRKKAISDAVLEHLVEEKIKRARAEERKRIIDQLKAHGIITKDGIVESNGTYYVPERYTEAYFPATTVNGQVTYPGKRLILESGAKIIDAGTFDKLRNPDEINKHPVDEDAIDILEEDKGQK